MKNIREITKEECEEALEYVYPGKNYYYTGISHDMVIDEQGRQQLMLSGRSIIGIRYHNGQDNAVLHFDNTKLLVWLYKNGYDISEQLEVNSEMSEDEHGVSMMAFGMLSLAKGIDGFREGYKQNWTLEYVQKKCISLLDKWYYKSEGMTQQLIDQTIGYMKE